MVKVGIIGCGYWGPNLIRNLFELPDADVLLCCDLVDSRLKQLKSKYPTLQTTANYKDLLNSSIDAVLIATPAETHYRFAKEFLLAGKHVFVEKPLTFNVAEAEELVDISNKSGKILMVGHTFEYNPAVNKIKECIDNGELGQIYYISSRRLNLGIIRSDINVLWNLAPHDISIIIYLLGTMPEFVEAWGASFLQKNIEDVVFLNLTFPGNIRAHVHVSWLDPHKVRETVIVGSKKMIVYNELNIEEQVKIYDKGVDKVGVNGSDADIYKEMQLNLRSGDLVVPKIKFSEPLRNECQHFIDCVKENRNPLTDGENGLRVVKVLDAAQRSLKNKNTTV